MPASENQPSIENGLESTPEVEEMGRGRRIRKESAYVRRIRDGEGTATNRPSSRALPLGMQTVSEQAKATDCCMTATVED